MNILFAFFFYLLVYGIAIFPFAVLYLFSDLLSFILNHLVGYRKKVIVSNLKNVFPEMHSREMKQVVKMTYKNLADIFLEGIRAFTMTSSQVNKRHRIINPEVVNSFSLEGKSIIVVAGHYGNWEWGAFSASLQTNYHAIAFYKPLKNKWIDNFVKRSRAKFGTSLAPIRETTRTFENSRGKAVIYLMAADQSPSNRELAYWVNFLGRETAFLHGPEKHARINNYPVVFAAIRRVKRGYYELELSILAEDPSTLADGEITRRYASKMEELIREYPANWLWSHKRWKLTR